MRLRKLLAGAAGVAGVAAANRALTARAGTLGPALPGERRTHRWRGFDVEYAEAGDPDGPDLVLLHGVHAAASSREFEAIFEELASGYHVVAPDLPGFGRSDRPQVAYSTSLYESFVADFLGAFDDPAVLATSLSGAYAAIAGENVPVSRLVLVCPTADTGPRRPWVRALLRSPVVGTGLFNLLVSKPSLRWFDERDGYFHESGFDGDVVEYQWRTAHQPNARYAPASFVGGFLDPAVDLGDELAERDVPVTLVWGREATLPPLATGRELAAEADARLVVVGESRLLPHDEHPREFLEAVADDLSRLDTA